VNIRVIRNLIQAGAFDVFNRRDVLYYSLAKEEYQEWDEAEMLKREMMVLDIPSENSLIEHYPNPYLHLDYTKLKDIDYNEKLDELWIRGIVLDYSIQKSANSTMQEFFNESTEMAFFKIDDGTKKAQCFIAPEQLTLYKDRIEEGGAVIIKAHTYGSSEKLYVDGVVDVENLKDGPLEHYINGREIPEGWNMINYVTYWTTKKGKNGARVLLDDGEMGLCFNFDRRILESGELIKWVSNKKPFINIIRRM
jgi:DNA polymerase III alpha subunit